MSDDKSLNDDVIVDANEHYSGQVTVEPPEEFVPCRDHDDLEGPFYKTQYVADKVGVNRQTIINYSNFFDDVLAIRRKPTGDREYTEESIRQIAFLIQDKKRNNRTLQQEAEYIKNRYGKQEFELAAGGVRALEKFFDEMKESMLSEQRAMFEEVLSSNRQLLEKRDETDAMLIHRLDEQAERYEKVIENQQEEIINLKKQANELQTLLKEKDEKKGFFGWLKK